MGGVGPSLAGDDQVVAQTYGRAFALENSVAWTKAGFGSIPANTAFSVSHSFLKASVMDGNGREAITFRI